MAIDRIEIDTMLRLSGVTADSSESLKRELLSRASFSEAEVEEYLNALALAPSTTQTFSPPSVPSVFPAQVAQAMPEVAPQKFGRRTVVFVALIVSLLTGALVLKYQQLYLLLHTFLLAHRSLLN